MFDDIFWDKAEDLSEGFIIQREIEKALSGRPFFINDEETLKPIRLDGIPWESFFYYYKIWENCDSFGLPHGKGWIEERQWLLEFLKVFNRAKTQVEILVEERVAKQNNTG